MIKNTILQKKFKDKTLLITGGTGSFGNEILRFFLKNLDMKEIRIFSRDEEKQDRMRNELGDSRVKFIIGDVRDFNSVDRAMLNVDFVFHAAALKQVPSCEFFPMEAVKTNIIGADNVLNAAENNGVGRVILLSTDKAVYPICAMGMTKSLMEKLMIAKSRVSKGKTIFCATRYGNVMVSRGSVIPLFVKQIMEGKDITVTDPNMTRFLMSLDEAVNLVLYAFTSANSGDIFVQKAAAATIMDLALALKEIFNSKSKIKIVGSRHSEKIYETLINREEMVKADDLGGFFRIPCDNRDLNYGKYFTQGCVDITEQQDYNSHNCKRLTLNEIKKKLLGLSFIQNELKNIHYTNGI